jgi:hypothetical protein
MIESVLVALVTLVLVGFLLLFVFGTQGNIRRGNAFMSWLQTGLPALGKRTTVRWLGSSAVVLNILEPHEPFAEAEVLVVLEPRDIGWLWAWSRRRGRRDFIILRGRLVRAPGFELEAGDEATWTGADRLEKLESAAWRQTQWAGITVAYTSEADVKTARAIWDELARASGGVWRMSVRRDRPHVEVHVVPPNTSETVAADLVQAFRNAGKAAMRT